MAKPFGCNWVPSRNLFSHTTVTRPQRPNESFVTCSIAQPCPGTDEPIANTARDPRTESWSATNGQTHAHTRTPTHTKRAQPVHIIRRWHHRGKYNCPTLERTTPGGITHHSRCRARGLVGMHQIRQLPHLGKETVPPWKGPQTATPTTLHSLQSSLATHFLFREAPLRTRTGRWGLAPLRVARWPARGGGPDQRRGRQRECWLLLA